MNLAFETGDQHIKWVKINKNNCVLIYFIYNNQVGNSQKKTNEIRGDTKFKMFNDKTMEKIATYKSFCNHSCDEVLILDFPIGSNINLSDPLIELSRL